MSLSDSMGLDNGHLIDKSESFQITPPSSFGS